MSPFLTENDEIEEHSSPIFAQMAIVGKIVPCSSLNGEGEAHAVYVSFLASILMPTQKDRLGKMQNA